MTYMEDLHGIVVPTTWCDCLCEQCVFERHGRCEVQYGCPESQPD